VTDGTTQSRRLIGQQICTSEINWNDIWNNESRVIRVVPQKATHLRGFLE
jgi:hypothetical protein